MGAPPRGLGAEEGRGQHLHHGLRDRPQRAVALLPDWGLQLGRNGLEVAALRAGGAGPEGEIPEEFEPVLEPNFYETVDPENKSRWFTHLAQESSALDSKMDFSRNLPKGSERGEWTFEGGRRMRSRTVPPEERTKLH